VGARLREKLTYANVMATIAVFVALGGSSYAAVRMTGKDVKDGSLTGRDIRAGSLTGKDVRRGSLTGRDVKNGSLEQRELSRRAVRSLTGRTGPQGPQGVPGAPATRLWAVVNSDGTLRRGSGVVASSEEEPESSNPYIVVRFNRDVSGCAHIVSLAYKRDGTANTGEIAADATTEPTVQRDSVTVQGFRSEGYDPPDSPPVNKDFQLAVLC
jgi:hypothetical protein